MSLLAYVGLLVGGAVVVLLVAFYVWVYLRNRAARSPGIVTRSRLTCPKCRRTFDYDYIPGASFSTVRLGTSRYMRCPLCRRWSRFELAANRVPRGGT
jgi:hypothetical protein